MKSADGLPVSETSAPLASQRLRSLMSVLADGEASEDEMDELWRPESGLRDCHGDWVAYHLIGDVLRGAAQGHETLTPASTLAQTVSQRLREESQRPPEGDTGSAQAWVQRPAANEAVFRWKLVAGLASLVAVTAVAWTSLGGLTPAGEATGAGSLAQNLPQPSAEPVRVTTVQTPQGPVTRDPQLEQLLAQHRQFGGVSAFQMPAGFIRNATYETTGNR